MNENTPAPAQVEVAGPEDPSALQRKLVDHLKQIGCLRSPHVEAAFRQVSRHWFLPGVPLDQVYRDEAIVTRRQDNQPVSSSSQPAIMAIMLEQLDLQPGQRVLEIGAGTGFNAALLAQIVGKTGQIVSVDMDEEIVAEARDHLSAAGYDQVQVVCADGGYGYAAAAPYDRIILTVGAWDLSPAWLEQMRPGGRLVLPLTIAGGIQASVALERVDGHLTSTSVQPCGFMRLRGAFAGPDSDCALGPEPGLWFGSSDITGLDPAHVYSLVTSPFHDQLASIQVKAEEMAGLMLWLAIHEPGFCLLSAENEWVERRLAPGLFDWAGRQKFYFTVGVLEQDSLCILARSCDSPVPSKPVESPELAPSFEIVVRYFGSREPLGRCVVDQLLAWDRAGRPTMAGLRIRVYPPDSDYTPGPQEVLIVKKWTRLVLDWQRGDTTE